MKASSRILALTLIFLSALPWQATAKRLEYTGDTSPENSYIPLMTGADVLTRTPRTLPTPQDLALRAASNKFVGVYGDGQILRSSPDRAAMRPYSIVLGLEAPRSTQEYSASVSHVLQVAELNDSEVSSAESGLVTGGRVLVGGALAILSAFNFWRTPSHTSVVALGHLAMAATGVLFAFGNLFPSLGMLVLAVVLGMI